MKRRPKRGDFLRGKEQFRIDIKTDNEDGEDDEDGEDNEDDEDGEDGEDSVASAAGGSLAMTS